MSMNPDYLPIVDSLLLLLLFVGAPLISVAIGFAAWKGRSANFNREKFFFGFIVSGAIGTALMVFAQRMHADVRTPAYFLQMVTFVLGAVLFGIGGGCLIGLLIYGHAQGTGH